MAEIKSLSLPSAEYASLQPVHDQIRRAGTNDASGVTNYEDAGRIIAAVDEVMRHSLDPFETAMSALVALAPAMERAAISSGATSTARDRRTAPGRPPSKCWTGPPTSRGR